MGENPDPGSGINIPDPQHCFQIRQKMYLNIEVINPGEALESTSRLKF